MSAAKSLKASLDVTRLHEAAGLDGTIQVGREGQGDRGQGKGAKVQGVVGQQAGMLHEAAGLDSTIQARQGKLGRGEGPVPVRR